MKVNDFIEKLEASNELVFSFEDGTALPSHFHITEMGFILKKYTDCGNTYREEDFFSFQLWHSTDIEHRLSAQKTAAICRKIINQKQLNPEIVVEYQMEQTIGKFHLDFQLGIFILKPTKTSCLAKKSCGIPVKKQKIQLHELKNQCGENSNCC